MNVYRLPAYADRELSEGLLETRNCFYSGGGFGFWFLGDEHWALSAYRPCSRLSSALLSSDLIRVGRLLEHFAFHRSTICEGKKWGRGLLEGVSLGSSRALRVVA